MIALLLTCAVGLAACGSSDNDSDASATDAAATATTGGDKAPSGDPIKVMAIGPLGSATVSLPSIKVGAQVGVDEVNAKGGINGRPLELIFCDEKNDPNAAVGCARQAIKDDVVAVVGGFTGFEPQVVPVLEKAGIPWVGNTAVQNSTSKSYYLLGGEGAALAFAMAKYLSDPAQGCKQISAVAENAPSSKAAVQLFQAGVSAFGGKNGKPAYGAEDTADWGPAVAAAIDSGSDCLGLLGTPANTPKIITAINQSGQDITTAVPLSLFPDQAVAAMGKAADGVVLTSGYLPLSSDKPAVRNLVEQAQKIDPDVPLDGELESTYASVLVAAKAAEGLEDVTPQALSASLDKLKGFDTGLGPVVDFTRTNPTKLFSRVLNTNVFVLKAQDGKTVLAQPEPIDTKSAFDALAAAGQ
jgi:ABC-type branched-subunit amino acid transport system substrate-binding protein